MKKQSHAGGTAADVAAALVIHDHVLQSLEQTAQVLGKTSPGQSRGPKDPLTKRVSLPAHRELLEE